MSKFKKVLALLLVVALTAALSVSLTMAYLQDEDSDVNVMTVGSVYIRQDEWQRVEKNGEFTAELEPYEQGKLLMPVTYPGNRTADDVTIGGHEITLKDDEANYVDKIVTVTNTGKSDAFVRTLVAVPTGGEAWEPDPVAANDCWLHWNYLEGPTKNWTLNSTATFIEIAGKGYYVWEFVHQKAIKSNETTYPVIRGFYMDKKVNNDDKGFFMTYENGTTKRIDDFTADETVNVLVLSQAVQTEGFDTPQNALDTAFGDVTKDNATKWFNGMVNTGATYSEPGEYEINKAIIFEDGTGDNIVANKEGVVVNVTGGYYDAGSQRNNCAVWAYNGGTINIHDGTFIADGDAAPATSASHLDLIYAGTNGAGTNGKINIYGGTFSLRNNNGWLLNEADGKGEITVYGGSFLNWNPADNVSEGADTNFLAEGYTVETEETAEGTWYHVVPMTNP